jgi:hypothetical protein
MLRVAVPLKTSRHQKTVLAEKTCPVGKEYCLDFTDRNGDRTRGSAAVVDVVTVCCILILYLISPSIAAMPESSSETAILSANGASFATRNSLQKTLRPRSK